MSSDIIYKNTCAKWVNKLSGEIIYLDHWVNLGDHNNNWFLLPSDAQCATYSNNEVRSDVLLFWKFEKNEWFIMNQKSKEWFTNGDINDFLTTGTYKGKIIWSLFK